MNKFKFIKWYLGEYNFFWGESRRLGWPFEKHKATKIASVFRTFSSEEAIGSFSLYINFLCIKFIYSKT